LCQKRIPALQQTLAYSITSAASASSVGGMVILVACVFHEIEQKSVVRPVSR
jgi:hypothetical protein